MLYVAVIIVLSTVFQLISGHGRLMDPPARNSMWRLGFNNPVNWNDNELYCGGKMIQWVRNKGKCGVCGDPYHGDRKHELGGKYANNIITRTYKQGDEMPVTIHLTANHRGWFEFKICPVINEKKEVTQDCLDERPLERADQNGTKFYVPKGKSNALFNYTLKLPDDLECDRCVVQWLYRAGNTWDKDDKSGTFCLGCGPQEEFYNCADISIKGEGGKHRENISTKGKNIELPIEEVGETKTHNVIRYAENVDKTAPVTSVNRPSSATKTTIASIRTLRPSTTELPSVPTEQVRVLKIPNSSLNEVGTIPTVKEGVSMALEKLKHDNIWKSTIDIITEGSTITDENVEQVKAKDGEPFRSMKWWTASPVIRETTTFPWSYASKVTSPKKEYDAKKVAKPGRHPESLSPFANSWAWQYSWIKSNFIFDVDSRQNNKSTSNDIIRDIFSTKPRIKMPVTQARIKIYSTKNRQYATSTPITRPKTKSSHTTITTPPTDFTASVRPTLPSDLSYLVTKGTHGQGGDGYKAFESEPDEIADLIHEFIDRKQYRYPEDESTVRQYATPEVEEHHYHNHPQSDIRTQVYGPPYRCPPSRQMPRKDNWEDVSSYDNKPPPPREQQYWSSPVYQAWPSVTRSLRCRARIKFNGGMDEWCNVNCNANFCPPTFCICQQIYKKPTYKPVYPKPLRESWNAYEKPMHVKQVPWEHQYVEKTQQKAWSHKHPDTSLFSKGIKKFLSKEYKPLELDQNSNIRKNTVDTNFPGVQVKSKRKTCVAIGRYSGQSQYDNWCKLNCSASFCPPLFCKCFISY